MEEKINLLISQLGDLRVKKNVDLSGYLESKKEGKAEAIFIATSVPELTKAIFLCKELEIPFFLIGSGSKITFLKTDISGLVIKNRSHNLKIFGVKGKVSRAGIGIREAFIEADSGTTLSELSDFASKQGLSGFEELKSIIGTVGGSILSNSILREKTTQVSILDNINQEKTKDINELSGKDIVLRVVFHLKAKEV